MPSIAPDQDLRPRTARNLCIENTPAAVVTTGLAAAAAGTGLWWVGALALLPISAAGWHTFCTISNERKYARRGRDVVAARERRARELAAAEGQQP
ncbi:hypothetical protein [Amycolatopsis sp. lyj-23]|uniref:hypothetical protein n=1 Tax=Amycolatopsis sp. lyj-23 TaxID=2789283 RepID=UPI00397C0BBC